MSDSIHEHNGTVRVVSEDGKKFALLSADLIEDMLTMYGMDINTMFMKYFDHWQNVMADGQYIFKIEKSVENGKLTGFNIKISKKEIK